MNLGMSNKRHLMNYSINVTVHFDNIPVIFRVTRTSKSAYFAVSATEWVNGFTIKKKFGNWRSEGEIENWKAMLIGEQIDKLNLFGLKGPICLS